MDTIEIFQLLGIEVTGDETEIKNAYRRKLAVTNPEDDPEGFRRLRAAYEEACRLARKEEKTELPSDNTPSGKWMEQVSEVYGVMSRRRDVEEWKKLFASDCFLSLEEEENCRTKFWRFLMEHFRLPDEVWKFLDKKLGIIGYEKKLREFLPGDFVRFIRNKCERGEEVEFAQFEGAEDAPYDLFLQYYDRCWQALAAQDRDGAAQNLKNADELKIHHPVMEICRAELLFMNEQKEEAIAVLDAQRKRYPEDGMINYHLAEILWRLGDAGEGSYRLRAGEIYLELKKENDKHYMANVRLTEWYYDRGQYREAKKCAEKVLAAGMGDDFLQLLGKVNAELEKELEDRWRRESDCDAGLELCWCYLQDGRVSRGIRLALKLEKRLSEDKTAEWNGLMSKLYVEQGEYETSITMTRSWEEALREKIQAGEPEEEEEKDRDRLKQARLIRMQCFHNLGFRDREKFAEAIQEGKSVLEGSAKDIGILLEMAQIYTEMQEYEQMEKTVEELVENYQIYAAYATRLEADRRRLDAGAVIRDGSLCIQYFPTFVKAYEYMAKVFLDLERWDDLDKLMKQAEEKQINSTILEAYRYQKTHKPMEPDRLDNKLKSFRKNFRVMVELGKLPYYEHGLPVLNELLYNCPDGFMFVERGIFHRSAHHYQEAREDFEKAISMNQANSYALNGLSFVMKYLGDYEKALFYMKKAVLYMDKEVPPVMYSDMGAIYALLGDCEMALAMCRQYEELARDRSPWLLKRMAEYETCLGNIEAAAALYRESNCRDAFQAMDGEVLACVRCGETDRARQLLEKWEGTRTVTERLKYTLSPMLTAEPEYRRLLLLHMWVALVSGEKEEAGCIIKKLRFEVRDEKCLGDGIFGAILCEEEACGKKMAANLERWLKRDKMSDNNQYFNREKAYLRLQVLAAWYTASEAEIEELLEKESQCGICHECASPVCRELEGIRILLLLRQGRIQEAKERLQRNLQNFSSDEYTRAIAAIHSSRFGDFVI
ncbi:MAG: hypothetical protein ACI4HQ_01260 [Acetatifactor sp.]